MLCGERCWVQLWYSEKPVGYVGLRLRGEGGWWLGERLVISYCGHIKTMNETLGPLHPDLTHEYFAILTRDS